MSAPDRVLQAAIAAAAGLDQPSSATPASKAPAFIPAPRWQGAKEGYYFSRGSKGLGYYRDPKQAGAANGDAAAEDGAEDEAPVPAQRRVLTAEELLAEAEEQVNIDEIQLLDARGLKRLVASFEKKYKDNLEARMKYSDAPEKFLDSEVDLDEQIKSLLQVASSPELYPLLVELNPLPTLLACVMHENGDIAADTLELLRELTDADAVEDYQEEARALVEALLDANALELLVQRLGSLDEKVDEEVKAVFNCLCIFENFVEVDTRIAESVVEKTKLLKWLLARIRPREFDGNKQQASELLAVLMQGSEKNQRKLGEMNGIEVLLMCTALYKARDPNSAEEEEFMQNCFDVLCSAMMLPENKAAFVKAEGVELMWLMMQNKKQSRYGALKLLDFACTRYTPPCEKLVDLGGLKHLFAAFMGKARIRGPAGERDVEQEVEERSVSLISSLLTNLGPRGGRRERVGAKFVEAEFEKTDRLMEIYFRYVSKVAAAEAKLAEEVGEEGEVDFDEFMMVRMDAGLFTLQQAAIIIGHLWAMGDTGLRKRVLGILHQKGETLEYIRDVLLEYFSSIGNDGPAEEAARLRSRAREALLALGATPEQLDELSQQHQQPGQKQQGQADGSGGVQGNGTGKSEAQRLADSIKKEDEDDEDGMELDNNDARPPPSSSAGVKVKKEEEQDEGAGRSGQQHAGGSSGRERDRGREDRGRDKDREEEERHRDRGREREKDRDRGEKDRERERDKGRDRHKEKERERDREKERERDKDKGREHEKERDRDRDRGGDREDERDRDRGSRRKHSRSRSPERDRKRR